MAEKKTTALDFHRYLTERSDTLQGWCRESTGITSASLMRFAELQYRQDEKLQNPKTWPSIYISLITAAQLGLEPAGPLGEAHIVTFFSKKLGAHEASLMPGYRGIIKLILQSGHVKSIRSHVVYERDTFSIRQGTAPHIEHEIYLEADRGKPIGAYSIARLSDGSDDFEWVPWADVAKIKAKAADTPAWREWEAQMARKVAIKRHANQLPLSPVARQAIEIDHATSSGDYAAARRVIDVEIIDELPTPEKQPRGAALASKLRSSREPARAPAVATTADEDEGAEWSGDACPACGAPVEQPGPCHACASEATA